MRRADSSSSGSMIHVESWASSDYPSSPTTLPREVSMELVEPRANTGWIAPLSSKSIKEIVLKELLNSNDLRNFCTLDPVPIYKPFIISDELNDINKQLRALENKMLGIENQVVKMRSIAILLNSILLYWLGSLNKKFSSLRGLPIWFGLGSSAMLLQMYFKEKQNNALQNTYGQLLKKKYSLVMQQKKSYLSQKTEIYKKIFDFYINNSTDLYSRMQMQVAAISTAENGMINLQKLSQLVSLNKNWMQKIVTVEDLKHIVTQDNSLTLKSLLKDVYDQPYDSKSKLTLTKKNHFVKFMHCYWEKLCLPSREYGPLIAQQEILSFFKVVALCSNFFYAFKLFENKNIRENHLEDHEKWVAISTGAGSTEDLFSEQHAFVEKILQYHFQRI